MTANGRINHAIGGGHQAPDQRLIVAINATLLKLGFEMREALLILRHDDQAAGILIQAMDDARATLYARQAVPAMMQQSVNQSATIPRPRMHHQPGRVY